MVFEPAQLKKAVDGAQAAASGAPALRLLSGTSVLNFLPQPMRWEFVVWDLPRVLVGCLPDSAMYNWCRTVPLGEMPFVISTCIEGGTTAIQGPSGKREAPPPYNFDNPWLTMPGTVTFQ